MLQKLASMYDTDAREEEDRAERFRRGQQRWVPDLLIGQVTGYVLGGSLMPDVGSAAGAPPPLSSDRLGEQQVEGGDVRHNEALADVVT